MPEEIIPGVYQTKITLLGGGMEHLNSYVVEVGDEVILVDTGIGTEQAFKEMTDNLEQIGLGINDLTCIFLTHFHIDHIGLFSKIKNSREESINAKLSSKEYEFLREYSEDFEAFWREQFEFGKLHGVPSEIINKLKKLREDFRNTAVYNDLANASIPVEAGGKIKVGKYRFTMISTPGHSPGHACYYEPEEKVLLAGDHLLKNTTPNVIQMRENENPLSDYFQSLEKMNDLEIKHVLPAHGEPYQNHRKRINQLKNHHKERLREIKTILKNGQKPAYKIASKVNWDLNYPNWEDFQTLQKWLAAGETLAHLKYLAEKGEIEKARKDEIILYRR